MEQTSLNSITTNLDPERGNTDCLQNHSLLCLSHVRWDLVFQRPQHLMTRFARCMPVYFVEEPSFERDEEPSLIRYEVAENLTVLVPHITAGMSYGDAVRNEKKLLHEFCREAGLTAPILWFYTPEALR